MVDMEVLYDEVYDRLIDLAYDNQNTVQDLVHYLNTNKVGVVTKEWQVYNYGRGFHEFAIVKNVKGDGLPDSDKVRSILIHDKNYTEESVNEVVTDDLLYQFANHEIEYIIEEAHERWKNYIVVGRSGGYHGIKLERHFSFDFDKAQLEQALEEHMLNEFQSILESFNSDEEYEPDYRAIAESLYDSGKVTAIPDEYIMAEYEEIGKFIDNTAAYLSNPEILAEAVEINMDSELIRVGDEEEIN